MNWTLICITLVGSIAFILFVILGLFAMVLIGYVMWWIIDKLALEDVMIVIIVIITIGLFIYFTLSIGHELGTQICTFLHWCGL